MSLYTLILIKKCFYSRLSLSFMQLNNSPQEDHKSSKFVEKILPFVKPFAYTWFHLQASKRKYFKNHDRPITFDHEKSAKEEFQSTPSDSKEKWAWKLLSKLQKDVLLDFREDFVRSVSTKDPESPCIKSQGDKQGKMRRVDCLRQADKIWRLDLVMVILFKGTPLENTDSERVERVSNCTDPLCINPYHVLVVCRELDIYTSYHLRRLKFQGFGDREKIILASVHSVDELLEEDFDEDVDFKLEKEVTPNQQDQEKCARNCSHQKEKPMIRMASVSTQTLIENFQHLLQDQESKQHQQSVQQFRLNVAQQPGQQLQQQQQQSLQQNSRLLSKKSPQPSHQLLQQTPQSNSQMLIQHSQKLVQQQISQQNKEQMHQQLLKQTLQQSPHQLLQQNLNRQQQNLQQSPQQQQQLPQLQAQQQQLPQLQAQQQLLQQQSQPLQQQQPIFQHIIILNHNSSSGEGAMLIAPSNRHINLARLPLSSSSLSPVLPSILPSSVSSSSSLTLPGRLLLVQPMSLVKTESITLPSLPDPRSSTPLKQETCDLPPSSSSPPSFSSSSSSSSFNLGQFLVLGQSPPVEASLSTSTCSLLLPPPLSSSSTSSTSSSSSSSMSLAITTVNRSRVRKHPEPTDSAPKVKRRRRSTVTGLEDDLDQNSGTPTLTLSSSHSSEQLAISSPNFLRSDRLEGFKFFQSSASSKSIAAPTGQLNHRLQSDHPSRASNEWDPKGNVLKLRIVGAVDHSPDRPTRQPSLGTPTTLIIDNFKDFHNPGGEDGRTSNQSSPPSDRGSPAVLPQFFTRDPFFPSQHFHKPVAIFRMDDMATCITPSSTTLVNVGQTTGSISDDEGDENGVRISTMSDNRDVDKSGGQKVVDLHHGTGQWIKGHRSLQLSPLGTIPISGANRHIVLGYPSNVGSSSAENNSSPVLCCLNAGGLLSPTPPFILPVSPAVTPKTTPRSTPIPHRWCTPFFLDVENETYPTFMVNLVSFEDMYLPHESIGLTDRCPDSVSTPNPLTSHMMTLQQGDANDGEENDRQMGQSGHEEMNTNKGGPSS